MGGDKLPGARLQVFREGDIAEAFVGAMLRRIAFVAPVPREEDTGHDFICALSEKSGSMITAGPMFTVQTKSSSKPIRYSKKHEVDWITKQENPFFVIVTNRKEDFIEIYSTWNRMGAFLTFVSPTIRLIPNVPKKGKNDLQWTKSKRRLDIYLGEPILRITTEAIRKDSNANSYARILKEWIKLDRENIVRTASKMYLVKKPKKYSTNRMPLIGEDASLFYNKNNLRDCKKNFYGSSIAIQLTLSEFKKLTRVQKSFYQALPSFLEANKAFFDSNQRRAIDDLVGLSR
jgi:hypothetical protein